MRKRSALVAPTMESASAARERLVATAAGVALLLQRRRVLLRERSRKMSSTFSAEDR